MNNSYLKTVAITLLIALLTIIGIYVKGVQKRHASTHLPSKNEIILENKKKIDNLLYEDKIAPYNFKTNLEIAILYDALEKKHEAVEYYKKAILYSAQNVYEAHFRLANHYLNTGNIDEAQKIFSQIPETQKASVNATKARYLSKLAKKYKEKGDVKNALNYCRAAYGFDSGNKKLKEDFLKFQLEYADKLVHEERTSEALKFLRKIEIPSLEKDYKIALLLLKDNPNEALNYFEKIYYKDPVKVNAEIFYNLLDTLEKRETNKTKAELYRIKKARLKNFIDRNVAYAEEIQVVDSKKIGNYFTFKVKNTSNTSIKTVFVGGENLKSIGNNPLDAGKTSKRIRIRLNKGESTKIYYSKNPDVNKVLIYEINL